MLWEVRGRKKHLKDLLTVSLLFNSPIFTHISYYVYWWVNTWDLLDNTVINPFCEVTFPFPKLIS